MSDYERGPYTPQSERLAFDPRQPVRGGGPAPVTLIISALVLVAIVGGLFLIYRHGVRHKGGAPAVVGAPLADVRTAAPADNGAPAGLVIDKSDASVNAAPAFAPPPEQPLPRPAAIQPEPPPAPKPVATATLPPAQPPRAAATVQAAAPAPVVVQTPPARVAVAAPRPAPPPIHARPLTIASLADDAVHHAGPKPPAAPRPSPLKPQPSLDAAFAAAAAPHPSTASATAAGANWAQIGALSSPVLADKAWADAAKLQPAAMTGKGKQVQTADVNGRTYYRSFVTGFSSHAAAEAFCARLKAASKPCIVH